MGVVVWRMFPRLEGKVVLVTGASAGIGEACAHQFAASGAKVILTARRVEKLRQVEEQIKQKNPEAKVHVTQLDVTVWKQVEETIKSLPEEFRAIDVLVNNAGLAKGVALTVDNEPEDIDIVIDTNVKGLFYVTRAVLSGMIERNQGHVINISSVAGINAYKGGSIYCASKFAVQAATESLRKEVVDKNIRVTAICPGLVETEFSVVRFSGDQNRADSVYKGINPLLAEDIADNVLYVASRPPHVQIAEVVVYPTNQASVEIVHRESA